jgi:hypothetical protein
MLGFDEDGNPDPKGRYLKFNPDHPENVAKVETGEYVETVNDQGERIVIPNPERSSS